MAYEYGKCATCGKETRIDYKGIPYKYCQACHNTKKSYCPEEYKVKKADSQTRLELIKYGIEYVKNFGKIATTDNVIEIAKKFEGYVMED